MTATHKHCSGCGLDKPRCAFTPRGGGRVRCICKDCLNLRKREWRKLVNYKEPSFASLRPAWPVHKYREV